MRPSYFEGHESGMQRTSQPQDNTIASVSSTRRTRTDESWIEINSRSSSSLSSGNDLVAQTASPDDRQSRPFTIDSQQTLLPRSTSVAGSSQDEYEESESESDRVLSSSNEDIYQQNQDDDDDDRTALGIGTTETPFMPQPNAFSHPPQSTSGPNRPYLRTVSTPASTQLRSDRPAPRVNRSYTHRERNFTTSYQPDHDAALRASLTTLLSCAAAVRPKAPERSTPTRPSTVPTTLRLVPESELNTIPPRRAPSPKQSKRKSRESSKERHSKKIKPVKTPINEDLIGPTLTSWMISAGVVLVFSAISFSAGFAWGREVGRVEGEMASCGQEVLRGSELKRLRWSATSNSVYA